jgi:peptidyl-prolyl cis-trans isomerase NIMA-interacting 1
MIHFRDLICRSRVFRNATAVIIARSCPHQRGVCQSSVRAYNNASVRMVEAPEYASYSELGAGDSEATASHVGGDGYGNSNHAVLGLDEVATAAAQAVQSLMKSSKPPPPLPPGWHVKESLSQPGYCYYFHQSTGVCSWQPPMLVDSAAAAAGNDETDADEEEDEEKEEKTADSSDQNVAAKNEGRGSGDDGADVATAATSVAVSRKRPGENDEDATATAAPAPKRAKIASDKPKQVRILHILKKHKDSRRPSSWRQPKVTITKEEASEELKELQSILLEESGDNLRATFEELARTESDCSSAKRGGDLGFFGPKKMQPAFEEASFALEIGKMSDLVETSSGVHILLRVG